MTRRQAGERFIAIYALAFVVGLTSRVADPPEPVRIAAVGVFAAALLYYAVRWLTLSVRDGALTRALPDYPWAALTLLTLALGCALIALIVLLALGEEVTTDGVSTGAAIGVGSVLLVWCVLDYSRRRRRSS